MRQQTTRVERERRYPMSVGEAWRLLADTDHLNRTIGLPPVEFTELSNPLLRRAEAKAFGVLPVRWTESRSSGCAITDTWYAGSSRARR